MSVCVFTGPTLAPADAARVPKAIILPPARQGDVYRAVSLLHPRAIAIIDGYFQWAPSVWHKEILWAMQQGVHVFGAASMGALRAAELASFGMRGVGRIFEAYRDGTLAGCGDEPFEDDDEVAVVHGPPEIGYVAASEAMVNIRCTLAAARAAGVIHVETCARLTAIAKAQFFPERSYERLFDQARAAVLPDAQLDALQAWLPGGRVDQKRADALAMLETMRDFLAEDPAPAKPDFSFEHTTLWQRALVTMRQATVHDPEESAVLDELRLDGARWDALRREVLRSLQASASTDAAAGRALLAQRLADNRGKPREAERLLEDAARRTSVQRSGDQIPPELVERQMLARIRDTQEFSQLRERANDKLARIGARHDLPDAEEFSDLQLLELRDWYFSKLLEREMPDDLAHCVRNWGYRDLPDFHRAIFTEYVYRQMAGGDAARERTRAGG